MKALQDALEVGVQGLRCRKVSKSGDSPLIERCARWRRETVWQDIFYETIFLVLNELLQDHDLKLVRETDDTDQSVPD